MLCKNDTLKRNMLYVTTVVITFIVVAFAPDMAAYAETPEDTDTGFGAAAYQVYSIFDGDGGLIIALLGGAIAAAGMANLGPKTPLLIGGAGTAIVAGLAPDAIVTISGGGIV